MFTYHVFETPLGAMAVVARGNRIARIVLPHRGRAAAGKQVGTEFPGAAPRDSGVLRRAAQQLTAYATGSRKTFNLPLDLEGTTDFRRRVLEACAAIPFGECWTYGQLGEAAGSPTAARAVGQIMSRNPLPIVIPCHRVVGADRRLIGFSAPGGLRLKERLLHHEGIAVRAGKVVVFL